MRYFKARFKIHTMGARNRYIYPEIWDSKRLEVVYDPKSDGIGKQGTSEQECLIFVEDEKYADSLVKDPSFTQIMQIEAEDLMAKWSPDPKDQILNALGQMINDGSLTTNELIEGLKIRNSKIRLERIN